MSNYCTHSEVSLLLGLSAFSTSTTPTASEVTNLCTYVTAEIDTHLYAAGITAQPTDTNALNMLKLYSAKGVACIVGKSKMMNVQSVDGSQPDSYCTEYKDFLVMLDDKPEIFGAAIATTINFDNQVTDGTYTEEEVTDKITDIDEFEI